jgi:hypothetical protein
MDLCVGQSMTMVLPLIILGFGLSKLPADAITMDQRPFLSHSVITDLFERKRKV